jgi:hypothetical protein
MVQRYSRSITFNDSLKFYKAPLSWRLPFSNLFYSLNPLGRYAQLNNDFCKDLFGQFASNSFL